MEGWYRSKLRNECAGEGPIRSISVVLRLAIYHVFPYSGCTGPDDGRVILGGQLRRSCRMPSLLYPSAEIESSIDEEVSAQSLNVPLPSSTARSVFFQANRP